MNQDLRRMAEEEWLEYDCVSIAGKKFVSVEDAERACRKAIAAALAKLTQRQEPVAWSVTYNGEHTGNFNLTKFDAKDKCASLNRLYPNDKREVVPLYTLPIPSQQEERKPLTPDMVVRAARRLCKIHAGQCQVDEEDTWKVYGEQFLADAKDALNAALLSAGPARVEPTDWDFIRAHNSASQQGFIAGTSNWAAHVRRFLGITKDQA